MTTIGVFWLCSPTYGHRRREARNLDVERRQDELRRFHAKIYARELDEAPPRNRRIRRGGPTGNRDRRYRVSLWITRLKVRILPSQPPLMC